MNTKRFSDIDILYMENFIKQLRKIREQCKEAKINIYSSIIFFYTGSNERSFILHGGYLSETINEVIIDNFQLFPQFDEDITIEELSKLPLCFISELQDLTRVEITAIIKGKNIKRTILFKI